MLTRISRDSYFRPPKGAKPEEARKWTDDDKTLLIQGIEKYGIGHFTEISRELLPKWVGIFHLNINFGLTSTSVTNQAWPVQSGNDLRLKTIRLIGRQNLQLYKGWKGNADEISRQFEKNKEVGLKYGTWKQGCLVYDDDGLVEQELLAMKRSDTATSADNEDSEVAVDDDVEMEDVSLMA